MTADRTRSSGTEDATIDTELWDQLSDAMLLVERGAIVGSNRAAQDLFGYSEQAFRAIDVDDLVPEAARSRHREWRQSFHDRRARRVMDPASVFDGQAADGSPLRLQIALIPFNGDSRRIIVVARATTRRPVTVQDLPLTDDEREELVQNLFAAGLLLRRRDDDPIPDHRIEQVVETLDALIAGLAGNRSDR